MIRLRQIALVAHDLESVVKDLDAATATGADSPLELRADEEVTSFQGTLAAPRGTRALNYAFDVTPADLITAIVTEDRVIRP